MKKILFLFSLILLSSFSFSDIYASHSTVDYLVVAGGGGGGSEGSGGRGAGGGAGGYLNGTGHPISVGSYTITIGAGGAGGVGTQAIGSNGGFSVFDIFNATGGGGGGSSIANYNGAAGGSGGGGSPDGTTAGNGGAGTVGQGNNGGNGNTGAQRPAGGGGGAGAVGGTATATNGGAGGAGLSTSISGTSLFYAGGGGGGTGTGTLGAGGSGIGGNGGSFSPAVACTAGTANRGAGGGGAMTGNGCAGGSGVVIIRYLTGGITATGGTITTSGAYTIHTFTTSGVFTVTSDPTDPPDAINDLTSTATTATSIDLDWTAPSAGGGSQTIIGYQINMTTPWTSNPLVYVNDTATTDTDYLVAGLLGATDYSFRVSAWTNHTNDHPYNNATGTVYNATTSSLGNPPTALVASSQSSTQIDLQWVAPAGMQNINGYRIQRETPIGTGWAVIVSNTTNTNPWYNNTGLTTNIIYNYRVQALNASGASSVSNTYDMTTFHLPNAVTDLTGTATDLSTIDLSWSAPQSYAPEIEGYMINGTTPTGDPVDILSANTGTTATTATALNLLIGQEYSFRVSPITVHGKNATGNIWNGSTIQTFVIGNLSNPDITNDDDFAIFFDRTDLNSSAIQLDVTYPNSYNLSCDFSYKYARTNQTYSGLSTVPSGTDDQVATFTLINATGDLVQVRCWDTLTGDESKYVITITDFPFLEQVRSLRNGDYGTFFQIGAFDGVMLIVIFLGMIGLNRTTPIVGIVFVVITTLVMSYFELITYPVIMYPALIMMIVWAFVTTRKDD